MVALYLGIICCYLLAGLAVHIAYYYTGSKRQAVRHYVLLGDNHQLQMEWYIRSIRWFSFWKGAAVKITVIDKGSTDETMAIVQKLAAHDQDLKLLQDEQEKQTGDYQADAGWRRFLAGSVMGRRHSLQEPHHYMWMLQEEGVVARTDHTVLVDLRQTEELAKLPL